MAGVRFSISTRLMLFIAIFVSIAGGMALTAVLTLRVAERNTVELQQKWLEGTYILGKIDFSVVAFRLAETSRALAPTDALRAAAEALGEQQRENINNLESQYTLLLGNRVPQAAFTSFQRKWADYQTAHDLWIAGDTHGLIDQPAYPGNTLDRHDAATDAAIDHLIDIGLDAGHARTIEVTRITRRASLVVILISMALACFIIFLIRRARSGLIRPLAAITMAMSRLAAGDRDLRIPGMERGDEIGEMAAACEVFRLNVVALDKAHEATRVAEKQAHMLARHDELTGLPNRRVFSADLQAALDQAKKGIANCSVLLIDLDNFKKVNDLQGHQTGDTVLCEIARRLEATMRKNDMVARLGGDEFAIIAEGEADLAEHLDGAKRLASRLLGAVRQPIVFDESRIEIAASIGIATCRGDVADVGGLLHAADIAMYRAKQNGRGTFRFFEQSMDDEMREREALEKDLVEAIAKNNIHPHYQPLVDIDKNRIRGFEALARWQHPVRGFVPPDIFIPIIEQLGLMPALTTSILRQACRDAKGWPEDIGIAVNFSPSELKDPLLTNRVLIILAEEGLAPSRLEVEITETALVSDLEGAKTILKALQGAGIAICLDDFGTGYSSLYHLRELKFDKIKIDRSFVQAMQMNSDSEKIVDAILGLTNSLGLPTVAEGIENPAILAQLAAKGCEYGQGFYFGKAMTGDAVVQLLKQGPTYPWRPEVRDRIVLLKS
jgi:diguanylate cyclase (GGDEF)-like protein